MTFKEILDWLTEDNNRVVSSDEGAILYKITDNYMYWKVAEGRNKWEGCDETLNNMLGNNFTKEE